jgi:hypothetical protein
MSLKSISHTLSFDESLDLEARVFSACFSKTFNKTPNKVFTSREVQEVASCTFNELERLLKKKK